MRRDAPSTFLGPRFPSTVTARVRDITSTSGSTDITRTRWISSWAGRSLRWSAANGWSSCVFWRTECRSTLGKRRLILWAWIRKRMCGGWRRFYAGALSASGDEMSERGRGARATGSASQWDLAQASAAATRLLIAGWEWSNHSTQREGVFSARFCSANLFIDEIKGSTVATDWKQYRSAWRSLKRE